MDWQAYFMLLHDNGLDGQAFFVVVDVGLGSTCFLVTPPYYWSGFIALILESFFHARLDPFNSFSIHKNIKHFTGLVRTFQKNI